MRPDGNRWIASSLAVLLAQRVSDAPNSMNQLRIHWRINLGAKLPDKHIKRIALDIAIMAPRSLNHTASRDHAPRIAHEHLQQYELRSCQRDGEATAPHLSSCWIEDQVTDPHL